jgi:hypothetical protein
MEKAKKLGIISTVILVLKDERVARLLWLIARSLLDDGKIDKAEKLAIKQEAMNILNGIFTGGR